MTSVGDAVRRCRYCAEWTDFSIPAASCPLRIDSLPCEPVAGERPEIVPSATCGSSPVSTLTDILSAVTAAKFQRRQKRLYKKRDAHWSQLPAGPLHALIEAMRLQGVPEATLQTVARYVTDPSRHPNEPGVQQ